MSSIEIRDLFRTIKATANFANVIYLLAFDTKVVSEALEQGYVVSGQKYLEKIVQVPFELPQPDKVALRQLFFNKLNQIIADTPEYLFDQMYWTNVYFGGIDHFINTPRQIVRLINVLRVTYPSVKGEVNPVDFISVESLRVFSPKIYNILRENENILTRSLTFTGLPENNTLEKNRKIYESWIIQVPELDREAVVQLLSKLFPKFDSPFMHDNPQFLSNWRKQLRICSPDIFSTYFRFSISKDTITASDIQKILNIAHNSLDFGKKLVEHSLQLRRDGTTKVSAILQRLEDYTKSDIPIENIEPIVSALFNVGDKLLTKADARKGILGFDNDIRISRVIYQLLFRLEEERRFQILYKAIEEGEALSISEQEIASLGQQHGKFTDSKPSSESEQFVTANTDQTHHKRTYRKGSKQMPQ